MAGATVTIEGSSDVGSVVAADLAKAKSALSDLEGGGSSAQGAMDLLGGAMSAIGAGVSIAGIANATAKLYELGAAASEASDTLSGLTGGAAPDYINAVTTASTGMVSKFDAATISNRALSYGFVTSAAQMGQLSEAAVVLGKTMGKDTTEAENLLIDAIGRGNTRMLAQLGIVQKGRDLSGEVNALMAQNVGMTQTQATQLAAFNAVMERTNQLKAMGISADNGADDSAQRLNASVQNLTNSAGQLVSSGLTPAVQGANNLVSGINNVNDAVQSQRQQLMNTTDSFDEFVAKGKEIPILGNEIWAALKQGGPTLAALRAEWEANNKVVLDNKAALYEEMDARRNDMAVTSAFSTTMGDLTKAYDNAKSAADEYQKVLDQQATIQMKTIGNIASLVGAKSSEAGGYQYAVGALNEYGFSASKTAQMTLDLALATHQVTNAQVDLAATIQGSQNLWAAGVVSAQAYAAELASVRAGSDAAMASLQAVADSVSAAYATAATSGKGYIAATSQAMADTAAASLKDAQDAASKVQAVFDGLSPELKINADATAVMTALNGIEQTLAMPKPPIVVVADTTQAKQKLDETTVGLAKIVDKKVTVTVNFVATGDTWASTGGGGGGGGGWTGGIVGYAGGTLNFPGGIGMVGEMGPELVHLPGGSHIYNANETQSMLSGASGGSVVNITLNAYGVNDPGQLVTMLEGELRARGKSFGAVR